MFFSPPLPFSVLKVLLLLLHLQVRDDCNYLSADVRENSVLQESASTVGWHVNIDDMISGVGREKLLQNTEEALNRGSFGVPRLVNTSTDVSCWLSMFFSFRLFLTVAIFRKKDSQCQINNYSSWSLILSTIEMASKCCSNNTHLCCIIHIVTMCSPVLPFVALYYPVLPMIPSVTLHYPV